MNNVIDRLIVPEIRKYDLSSFIPDGNPILKKYDQKEYSIQKYQGIHSEQYTIMEIENGVENGVAQLICPFNCKNIPSPEPPTSMELQPYTEKGLSVRHPVPNNLR